MPKINSLKTEQPCIKVGYLEGKKIAKELLLTALLPQNNNNGKRCVGLAHNQIGGDKRVYIVLHEDHSVKMKQWRAFINPTISVSSNTETSFENCMSYPKGKTTPIQRGVEVSVMHQIGENEFETEIFTGEVAIRHQHEFDHLEGIHIYNKHKEK
jgi:peptide deformylase